MQSVASGSEIGEAAERAVSNSSATGDKEHSKTRPKKPSKPAKNDEFKFKWVAPVKIYPEKYGPAKIRIIQDLKAHKHHRKHALNVYFQQYNEFVRIVFKNQKVNANVARNKTAYLLGLAKALGLKLNKEVFSEASLKLRESQLQLKEKLFFAFIKKMMQENKEIFATPPQGKSCQEDD